MKFVQPYFVVARKEGEGGNWELMQGEKAEQVFDWVLESGKPSHPPTYPPTHPLFNLLSTHLPSYIHLSTHPPSHPPTHPPTHSKTDLDYEFQLLEDENQ